MAADHRQRREFFKIYGPAFILVIAGLLITYQFIKPAPPDRVTLATGNPEGAYHGYAMQYRDSLAREGIELVLRTTSGAMENLALVASGEVDVAFTQGGIINGDNTAYQDLYALGSLYFEPLWLFHRSDLKLDRLDTLLPGHKFAIGPQGSGTRELVLTLLHDNGIRQGNAELLPMGGRNAVDALIAGEVDAVFLVSGAESPLIKELLASDTIKLASFERAAAYARRYRYLTDLVLPEGAVDLDHNLPGRQIQLLAPTAGLIAGKDLHPAVSDLLLQAAEQIHGDGGWFEESNQFPSKAYTMLPLSKEAERYYKYGPPLLQRYLPFWAASLVDRLKVMLLPLIVLLLPLFKIMPPIYTWRMRSRIYRWYQELERIDLEQNQDQNIEALKTMRDSLNELENEVQQIEVPLSFANQLYQLRLHIDLVRNRITKQIQ